MASHTPSQTYLSTRGGSYGVSRKPRHKTRSRIRGKNSQKKQQLTTTTCIVPFFTTQCQKGGWIDLTDHIANVLLYVLRIAHLRRSRTKGSSQRRRTLHPRIHPHPTRQLASRLARPPLHATRLQHLPAVHLSERNPRRSARQHYRQKLRFLPPCGRHAHHSAQPIFQYSPARIVPRAHVCIQGCGAAVPRESV